MLPLPEADQWVVVRAIAYSGLPDWKELLRQAAPRLPARQAMIDQYLAGTLPTLDKIELDKSPTFLEKMQAHVGIKQKSPEFSFGKNPGAARHAVGPVFRDRRLPADLPHPVHAALVEGPRQHRPAHRRQHGQGDARQQRDAYPDILALLKSMAKYQPEDVARPLAEVIQAAETAQAPRLKKDALAASTSSSARGRASGAR